MIRHKKNKSVAESHFPEWDKKRYRTLRGAKNGIVSPRKLSGI